MPAQTPKKKRPHGLLRALLTGWLLSWGLLILVFVVVQFSEQPLFAWPVATAWIAISVIGWILIFKLLRRLQKMPPE